MNSRGTGSSGFETVVVEVLKTELFTIEPYERCADYQHDVPRLKKDKVKRGFAHIGKMENLGVWATVIAKPKDEWTFVHISFPWRGYGGRSLAGAEEAGGGTVAVMVT